MSRPTTIDDDMALWLRIKSRILAGHSIKRAVAIVAKEIAREPGRLRVPSENVLRSKYYRANAHWKKTILEDGQLRLQLLQKARRLLDEPGSSAARIAIRAAQRRRFA